MSINYNKSLFHRLVALFTTVFEGENRINISKIKPDSSLVEDLGLNSIDMLYMALGIETNFGFKFKNEDFQGLVTVRDVMNIIEERGTKHMST